MKTIMRILGSCNLVAIGAVIAAMPTSATAQAPNDPGFESGGTAAWRIAAGPGVTARATRAAALTGAAGMEISSKEGGDVDVSQVVQGLSAGQYLLTAMLRNGGGQEAVFLYAKNCGGPARQTSVPSGRGWTKVFVRGIRVGGTSCTIGLRSSSKRRQALAMDDVELVPDAGAAYTFLQGGDVSRLSLIESVGARFRSDGVERDPMAILADNGFNYVRLRAYNDPGNPDHQPSAKLAPGFQDTNDILALARRAHAVGMGVQLSLNYSDWWADGCTQDVPHAWEGQSYDQIRRSLYDYTRDVVSRMVAQGTAPSIVSLGNQMQCGLLLKPGRYGPIEDWPKLAGLLKEGYRAVKDASPTSRVMLHLDSPGSAQWFFDGAQANGVPFDVIGLSWYPFWEKGFKHRRTETVPELLTILNEIGARYRKDVLIMETAVNWGPKLSSGYPGQLTDGGRAGYAQTPIGQRDFAIDLMNACKAVEGGRCIGIQWWDPIAVNQPGFGWIVGGGNSNDNSTVFDWRHEPLPVLTEAFRNNR